MKDTAQTAGTELKWVKPRIFRKEYELRAGEEVVARLRFHSSFSSLATAESSEGCWTFKRSGFWPARVTVRTCEPDVEIATFRISPWTSGGTLELTDGRKYQATSNVWQTRYQFLSGSREPLIRYRTLGMIHTTAQMEIAPEAADLPELPWMTMLGWYLTVMMNDDSASTAASVAAVAS